VCRKYPKHNLIIAVYSEFHRIWMSYNTLVLSGGSRTLFDMISFSKKVRRFQYSKINIIIQ
jgi:hypothetical protein